MISRSITPCFDGGLSSRLREVFDFLVPKYQWKRWRMMEHVSENSHKGMFILFRCLVSFPAEALSEFFVRVLSGSGVL